MLAVANSIPPTWSTKALPSLCLTLSPCSNMEWLWQRLQIPLLPYKLFLPPPSEAPSQTLSNYRRLPFLHHKSIFFHQCWVAGLDHSQLWNMLWTSASAYIKLFSLRRMRPSQRDWPNYQQCMREPYTTLQTLPTSEPPKRHNIHFCFRFKKDTYSSHFPQMQTYWFKSFTRQEVAMLTLRPILNIHLPFNLLCVSYLQALILWNVRISWEASLLVVFDGWLQPAGFW